MQWSGFRNMWHLCTFFLLRVGITVTLSRNVHALSRIFNKHKFRYLICMVVLFCKYDYQIIFTNEHITTIIYTYAKNYSFYIHCTKKCLLVMYYPHSAEWKEWLSLKWKKSNLAAILHLYLIKFHHIPYYIPVAGHCETWTLTHTMCAITTSTFTPPT